MVDLRETMTPLEALALLDPKFKFIWFSRGGSYVTGGTINGNPDGSWVASEFPPNKVDGRYRYHDRGSWVWVPLKIEGNIDEVFASDPAPNFEELYTIEHKRRVDAEAQHEAAEFQNQELLKLLRSARSEFRDKEHKYKSRLYLLKALGDTIVKQSIQNNPNLLSNAIEAWNHDTATME